MSFVKSNCNVAGLIGIMLTILIGCGGEHSNETTIQTADTGTVAVQIAFDPNLKNASNREDKAFSSCRDINTVTAQVFDGAGGKLSERYSWPCSARRGTIKNVSEGIDRQVIVRAVWVNDKGHETLFYEGRSPKFMVEGGVTTPVTVNVDFVPDFPELDPDQLEQLKFLADQDDDNYTISDGDCDDMDPERHPNAVEICNNKDDNCNGMADEPYRTYYKDEDGDGFGFEGQSLQACNAPLGWVEERPEGMDCNDSNSAVNPGAAEVDCDGLDNDCDGQKGCNNPEGTYYLDADGDGYGDQSQSRLGYIEGYVVDNTDCDDTNGNINPGITEICNGKDDNCNDKIDEGLLNEYHPDDDKDGYGDMNQTTFDCTAPTDFVRDGSDCNDENSAIHPGIAEQCNGLDDDCNGQIDDNIPTTTYYADLDGDGFGDPDRSALDCSAPTGYVETSGDCDDNNNGINPEIKELCNGFDDNCDGQIDEGCPWNKMFVGEFNSEAGTIIPGNTGGYVTIGDQDHWVMKIAENGEMLWRKTFEADRYGALSAVCKGNNGGYIILGSKEWMANIAENGVILWEKSFPEGNIFRMIPGNDGGYVVAGYTRYKENENDDLDILIMKIDESGNELWNKSFDIADEEIFPKSIIPGNDGGYIIVGTSAYILSYGDIWVFKIDESGNKLWDKSFSSDNDAYARSIIPGNNGGYVIAGKNADEDAWIIAIDESGDKLWDKSFGYPDCWVSANALTPGNSGGYVIAGELSCNYNHDALLIAIDESGDELWQRTLDNGGKDSAFSITSGNTGGYVFAGYGNIHSDNISRQDTWIVKTDETGNAPAAPSVEDF